MKYRNRSAQNDDARRMYEMGKVVKAKMERVWQRMVGAQSEQDECTTSEKRQRCMIGIEKMLYQQ